MLFSQILVDQEKQTLGYEPQAFDANNDDDDYDFTTSFGFSGIA